MCISRKDNSCVSTLTVTAILGSVNKASDLIYVKNLWKGCRNYSKLNAGIKAHVYFFDSITNI